MGEDQWRSESTLEEPVIAEKPKTATMPPKTNRLKIWVWVGIAVFAILILVFILFFLRQLAINRDQANQRQTSGTKVQEVDTGNLSPSGTALATETDKVVVNGSLEATNGVILKPSNAPSGPQTGQLYFDQTTNEFKYYNGTSFVGLLNDSGDVCNKNDASCGFALQTALAALQAQVNSLGFAITEGGVNSLQGKQGDLTLLGTGGLTIYTSGTSVTLALPQNLSSTGTPQFSDVSLTGSDFTQDSVVLVGSSGNLYSVNSSGASGLCLVTDGSGVPEFNSCIAGAVGSLNGLSGTLTIVSNNLDVSDDLSSIITIDSPQDLDVTDAPTFAGLTVSGNISQTGATTFSTGTGAVSLNGNTSVLGTSTFTSGTGSVTLNGATTLNSNFTQVGAYTFTTGTGAVLLDGDTTIGSALSANNLTVRGNSLFQPVTDSDSTFQVQNSLGASIFKVETTSISNLITPNDSFDANITGWSAMAGGVGHDAPAVGWYEDQSYDNFSGSMEVTNDNANGTTAGGGVVYPIALSGAPVTGTQYSITAYVKGLTSTSTVYVGYYTGADLSTESNTCSQTVLTSWSEIICTFTVPASTTADGIFVRTKAKTHNWLLDRVTLQTGLPLPLSNGRLVLDTSTIARFDSTEAFQVRNDVTATKVFNVNTTDGKVSIQAVNNVEGVFQVQNAQASAIFSIDAGDAGSIGDWTLSGSNLPANIWSAQPTKATTSDNTTYAYIIGGLTSGNVSVNSVYRSAIGVSGPASWSSDTALLPAARDSGGIVSAKGYIYYIGGCDSADTGMSTVYYSKIGTDGSLTPPDPIGQPGVKWVAGSTLNSARCLTQAVTSGGYVYVVGGASCRSCSKYDTIEFAKIQSDGSLGAWTVSTNLLPDDVARQSVVVTNSSLPGVSRIIVVGGVSGSASDAIYFAELNGANGETSSWQTDDTVLPATRQDAGIAIDTIDGIGYIYLIGGRQSTGATVDNIFMYAPLNTTATDAVDDWTVSYMYDTGQAQIKRIYPSVLLHQHTLFMIGGTGGGATVKNTSYFVSSAGSASHADLYGSLRVTSGIESNGKVSISTNENAAGAISVTNSSKQQIFSVDTDTSNVQLGGRNQAMLHQWLPNNNPLPAGRAGAGAAIVNGYIYAVSGSSSGNVYYAKVNTDGTTGVWTPTTALPDYKNQNATIAANGYIYVVGGYDSLSGVSPTNTIYYARPNIDGTITSWKTATTTLGTAVASPAISVANGYMYIAGGATSSSGGEPATPTMAVQYAKLNPDGSLGSFSSGNDLADPDGVGGSSGTALMGGRSVVANGYLYFLGGANSGGSTATSNVYYASINSNGSLGNWTINATPLDENRAYHTSIVANGYVYVLGGTTTTYADTNVDTILFGQLNGDGSISSWESSSSSGVETDNLYDEVSDHATAFANGYVYVIGSTPNPPDVADSAVIMYASTSRISVGGSLDLVGLGSRTLSDAGGGGQLTAGNTTVIGTLDVRDDVNLTQSLTVGGSFVTHGSVQVLNSSGYSLFGVDSTNGLVSFGNGTNGFRALFDTSALTADRTYDLPDQDGEICLSSGNCSGSGSSATLQAAYDAGSTLDTNNASDIDIDLLETAVDSSFVVDLQCATCSANGGRFAVQDSGVDVFSVVPNVGVNLGTASSATGSLIFNNSTNSNTLTLQSGVSGAAIVLTLPTNDGAAGDCLQSDGNGVLSFNSCTGGAGGVTNINGIIGVIDLLGTANQITVSNNSPGAGDITLSLPQNIHTAATPQFSGVLANSLTTAVAGTLSVGTSTATGITIGAVGVVTTFPGTISITGANTTGLTVGNGTAYTGFNLTSPSNVDINGSLAVGNGAVFAGVGSNNSPSDYFGLAVVNIADGTPDCIAGGFIAGCGAQYLALYADNVDASSTLFGQLIARTNNAGTTATWYGQYIGTPVVTAGAITNNYGMVIQAQTTGTTNYGALIGSVNNSGSSKVLWLCYDSDSNACQSSRGGITFGASADTNLYRDGANRLATDDTFRAVTALQSPSLDVFSAGSLSLGISTATGITIGSSTASTISVGSSIISGTSGSGLTVATVDRVLGSSNSLSLVTGTTTAVGAGTTGNITIQTGAGITAGNVTTGSININVGSPFGTGTAGNINIGTAGYANTLQFGNTTGAVAQTINIGTNSTASSTNNVTIGSTVAGTIALQGATTITNRTSGSASTLIINNSTSTGNILLLQDNATDVLTVADGGLFTLKPVSDSTTFIRILKADGTTNVATVNTSNLRIELGTGVDIRFDGIGNERNAITKIFQCGTVNNNDIVIISSSGTVGTTTTAGSNKVAGVVVAQPSGDCTVAIGGVVQVAVTGSVAAGDLLETSTSAGLAQTSGAPGVGAVLGVATSADSGGLAWVLIRGN
jgi:hypothetical protein